jgi:hypothetical protein
MRQALRLFLVMGEAAFIFTATYFALILIVVRSTGSLVPAGVQAAASIVGIIVSICLSAWWTFSKLRAHWARREARAAALAFGLFLPVPLAISLLLGPIIGGYTGIFLGSQSGLVAFSGAVMGIAVMIALMTFAASLLTLRTMRRIERPHQAQ